MNLNEVSEIFLAITVEGGLIQCVHPYTDFNDAKADADIDAERMDYEADDLRIFRLDVPTGQCEEVYSVTMPGQTN
jgi:hypothetical protein